MPFAYIRRSLQTTDVLIQLLDCAATDWKTKRVSKQMHQDINNLLQDRRSGTKMWDIRATLMKQENTWS